MEPYEEDGVDYLFITLTPKIDALGYPLIVTADCDIIDAEKIEKWRGNK